MADIKYYDVILKPVVTEKSIDIMADKKYTFQVNPEETKPMIMAKVLHPELTGNLKTANIFLNEVV